MTRISSLCSCPVIMESWVPERLLEMKKEQGAREGWSQDKGSKFNIQHWMYIGKAHRFILCFIWIMLENKLSRQSTPIRNCRCSKVEDSTCVVKVQMWQVLKVYLAYSRLEEGDTSPLSFFILTPLMSSLSLAFPTLTIKDSSLGRPTTDTHSKIIGTQNCPLEACWTRTEISLHPDGISTIHSPFLCFPYWNTGECL